MNFKSIDNKKIKNGKLRITEPVVIFPENTRTIAVHTVTSDEICRIDIISRIYYNLDDYSELILKFNNISNPFSINEGDVLNIPDKSNVFAAWKTIKSINTGSIGSDPFDEDSQDDSIKNQFISSKRLTVKDVKRAEYLKKKADQKQNGSKQILPPNILKDGDKNIDITGDTIII